MTTFPTQLLAPNVNWIAGSGQPTIQFYQLIRALFYRTGGAQGTSSGGGSIQQPVTVGTNLTAAGTTQGTALLLANDWNEILAGSGGVMLADLQPGQRQVIMNGLSTNLNVYPFFSGQIDSEAINAPFVLTPGKSNTWRCPRLLPSNAPYYRTAVISAFG